MTSSVCLSARAERRVPMRIVVVGVVIFSVVLGVFRGELVGNEQTV